MFATNDPYDTTSATAAEAVSMPIQCWAVSIHIHVHVQISMSSDRLEARRKLAEEYQSAMSFSAVTFQPLGHGRVDERMFMERWVIFRQRWVFLAVFDDHMGSYASKYSTQSAIRIRTTHSKCLGGQATRDTYLAPPSSMALMSHVMFNRLNRSSWKEPLRICRNPGQRCKEDAQGLIQERAEVLQRAWC
ncbi:hypothetical protein PYCCODRAFT_590329 [Trametes coccinea BRFM310]|uniref:Uncharacterized protein n=1 Tax=Trametes coccinea (strain BRFM310) TaxID=1353009 RepID=A0A1Y2J323_TRAC3|nr:hypothetical protein PYCCODRAFT_590329 [Trametes coccinea BRFM310]